MIWIEMHTDSRRWGVWAGFWWSYLAGSLGRLGSGPGLGTNEVSVGHAQREAANAEVSRLSCCTLTARLASGL